MCLKHKLRITHSIWIEHEHDILTSLVWCHLVEHLGAFLEPYKGIIKRISK